MREIMKLQWHSKISQLKNTEFERSWNTLEMFAYGTIADYQRKFLSNIYLDGFFRFLTKKITFRKSINLFGIKRISIIETEKA